MQKLKLSGIIENRNYGTCATPRLKQLHPIFAMKIQDIHEFFPGTLNVRLDIPYGTPRVEIIRFDQGEYGLDEGFTFIPILAIEGDNIRSFILRPDGNPPGSHQNGNVIAEIIAREDIRKKFRKSNGNRLIFDVLE